MQSHVDHDSARAAASISCSAWVLWLEWVALGWQTSICALPLLLGSRRVLACLHALVVRGHLLPHPLYASGRQKD